MVDSAAAAAEEEASSNGENLVVADQAESTNLDDDDEKVISINHREPTASNDDDDYEVFDTDGSKSAMSDAYEDTTPAIIIGQQRTTNNLVHFSSLPIHVSKLAKSKKNKKPRAKFNFTVGKFAANKSRDGLRTITISSPSNFVHVASVTKQPSKSSNNSSETAIAGEKAIDVVDESSTKYSVIVIKNNSEDSSEDNQGANNNT